MPARVVIKPYPRRCRIPRWTRHRRAGCGSYPLVPGVRQLKDVFELRKVLLGYAARTSLPNLKPHDIATLQAELEQMRSASRKSAGELNAFTAATVEFQRVLAGRLNNGLIERQLWLNGNLMRMWINLRSLEAEQLSTIVDDHAAMLEAAQVGDGKKLRALIEHHVDSVYQALSESLDAA